MADPLQEALAEAESLMQEVDLETTTTPTTTPTISAVESPPPPQQQQQPSSSSSTTTLANTHPLTTSATASTHPLEQQQQQPNQQHLHQQQSFVMKNHPPPHLQQQQQQQQPQLLPGTPAAGMNNNNNMAYSQQQQQQSSLYHYHHQTDAWKQQTTRFASNFVNMAQQGWNQVVTTTTTTTAPTTTTHTSSTPTTTNNNNNSTKAYTPSHASASSTSSSSLGNHLSTFTTPTPPPTTTTPSSVSSVVSTHNNNNNVVSPPPPPPALDKEEIKQLLISVVPEKMLPGEAIVMYLAQLVHVSDSSSSSSSTLLPQDGWQCILTCYRLVLFRQQQGPDDEKKNEVCRPDKKNNNHNWNAACWGPTGSLQQNHYNDETIVWQMPLASLEKVDKIVLSVGNAVQVVQKLSRRIIQFATRGGGESRALHLLHTYAFPGRRNLGYLFAFESKRLIVVAAQQQAQQQQQQATDADQSPHPAPQPNTAWPRRFDGNIEFVRQLGANHPCWALWSAVNQQYTLCASYPSVLVGPKSINQADPLIRQCAAFRSEGRLPVLTWGNSTDGASIWRSAQPKVGLQGNRSSADEAWLQHVAAACCSSSSNNNNNNQTTIAVHPPWMSVTGHWLREAACGLKIMDLRPRAAAMANRTAGYGYENTTYYTGTTLQFGNIGNIHAVRDAHQKLMAVVAKGSTESPEVQFGAAVEDTKWLAWVRLILAAAWEAAYWVQVHRLPVLVHCSHGWDRTSQVCALSQLLLDPYYRTRAGFACLIEKDFLAFGHPFHTRCAHGESGDDNDQISPIFVQFLDCVYQLVSLFPEAFEFNTRYLLLVTEHIYSCRFGNFLCDTEREREQVALIRPRTYSLWDYLDEQDDCINPTYTPASSNGVLIMPLSMLLRNVHLWVECYCQHCPHPTQRWQELDKKSGSETLTRSNTTPSVTPTMSFTIDDDDEEEG